MSEPKDAAPPEVESEDTASGRATLEPSRRSSKEKPVAKSGEQLSKVFEMAMGFTAGTAPGFHPLFEKFNDSHIEKFLDGIQKDDDSEHRLRSSNRIFHLIYSVLALGFFIFLIVYLLPQNKDLLVDFMKLVVVFAGGLGSGFGLKSHLDKKRGGSRP